MQIHMFVFVFVFQWLVFSIYYHAVPVKLV